MIINSTAGYLRTTESILHSPQVMVQVPTSSGHASCHLVLPVYKHFGGVTAAHHMLSKHRKRDINIIITAIPQLQVVVFLIHDATNWGFWHYMML